MPLRVLKLLSINFTQFKSWVAVSSVSFIRDPLVLDPHFATGCLVAEKVYLFTFNSLQLPNFESAYELNFLEEPPADRLSEMEDKWKHILKPDINIQAMVTSEIH